MNYSLVIVRSFLVIKFNHEITSKGIMIRFGLVLAVLLSLSSCAFRKGFLDKPSPSKGVGIVKFKILDEAGEDITNSCAVGYGDNGISPNLQLYREIPQLFEVENEIKIKYIHCLIYLRLYGFHFDSFSIRIKEPFAYNLGEYVFEYDYKQDYTETDFYKKKQNAYRKRLLKEYPDDNLSSGMMTLIEHKKINHDVLDEKFPKHNKKQIDIENLYPKNILFKNNN